MNRFKNKTSLKYSLIIVLLTLGATSYLLSGGHVAVSVALVVTGLLILVMQNWLIDLKRTLTRLEFALRSVKKVQGDEVSAVQDLAESLGRLNRKAIKNEETTNNIAGSVGRMAPLVRAIKVETGELTKLADQPPVQPEGRNRKLFQSLQNVGTLDSLVMASSYSDAISLNVMVIADEFSLAAFGKEWNQIAPTKLNYREILDRNKIDLLFVESAWEANGGEWRYQLVGSQAPRAEITDLVKRCQDKGIPTVFWNKEDPPHYEDFIRTAKLFDYVFTTEERKIEQYRLDLGHDRVDVLPFAAQPFYHNPSRVRDLRRSGSSVFGGMYFREKYPERRDQMNFLLPAASEFGLDIYSRNTSLEKYAFPKALESDVLGSLSYAQMVAAYHAYKVVLNVNSVADSASMCARRVFEASACGAAVVSPPTKAITNFFPDNEITLVDTRDSARNSIRSLLRSDEYRDRKVHLAQRRIWEQHTYRHRVQKILRTVGLWRAEFDEFKTVSVIIPTNRPESFKYLLENVSRQVNVKFELLIATHGFTMSEADAESVRECDSVERLIVLAPDAAKPLGAVLNELVDESTGDFIIRMDDDDWYGPNYAADMVHAINFSGAELVGKSATYIYFESSNSTVLTLEGSDHRYTDFVRGATFAGPRETFEKFRFPELGVSEDSTVLKKIKAAGGKIYASDRFNFIVNRFSDKNRHTWLADDMQLFSTGRMVFSGNGQDQLAV